MTKMQVNLFRDLVQRKTGREWEMTRNLRSDCPECRLMHGTGDVAIRESELAELERKAAIVDDVDNVVVDRILYGKLISDYQDLFELVGPPEMAKIEIPKLKSDAEKWRAYETQDVKGVIEKARLWDELQKKKSDKGSFLDFWNSLLPDNPIGNGDLDRAITSQKALVDRARCLDEIEARAKKELVVTVKNPKKTLEVTQEGLLLLQKNTIMSVMGWSEEK